MEWPDNYIYHIVNSSEIRTNFKTKQEVEQWVHDLELISKITWYITRTIVTPTEKARQHVFKRVYHCQFKTKTNKLKDPRKREHSSRNINCPAELLVVIKKQVFHPRTKLKHVDSLLEQWPCIITIKNEHNHTVNSVAALTKRPIGKEAKEVIFRLFERGHLVASAYNSFCFTKMEELGDKYNEIVCDRHYFPSKGDFSNLWKTNFKGHYGDRSGENMFFQLEENLKHSIDTVYKITQNKEDYAVSLCTPIIQRAARHLIQASEILFVDATSNCDVQNHKLYFFATQSPAGGIPLGCIITNSQKASIFDCALRDLVEIKPFKISPAVIMTDDDLSERNVLQKYWPKSSLLLCSFHVLKAVWKWLQLAKNEIKKEDRQSLYKLFRNILKSKTKESMEKNLAIFYQCYKYPQYKKYIDSKIEQIEVWCLYHRQSLMIRGADTNNYVEVMFRLFKDISLERTKAYNLTQLTDFIISSFDSYYKQRLLDLVMNKINKSTLNRLSPNDKEILPNQIKEMGEMQYHVLSSSNEGMTYFVDMNSNICSCPIGITGKICKHQSAIIKQFNITNACNTLSLESRKMLYFIATGKEPSENVLLPLKLVDCPKIAKNYLPRPIGEYTSNDGDDACKSIVFTNSEQCLESSGSNSNDVKIEWCEFISKFNEDILKNLEADQLGFSPAVEQFMKNYHKNINSSSTLMSGLYTAFKFDHLPRSLTVGSKKITRKGKKNPVQPTSVSRRKVKMTGRRSMQAGRKVGRLTVKKSKSPHSLNTCVNKNIGLGENKFAK